MLPHLRPMFAKGRKLNFKGAFVLNGLDGFDMGNPFASVNVGEL